jgi:hypothetical protein
MNNDQRPAASLTEVRTEIPRHPVGEHLRETLNDVRDFIERAREHHARTGEWPPDPLLDELNEMRRRVEAEHGPDPRKVLEWYIRAGKRHVNGDALRTASDETPDRSGDE